MKSYRTAKSSWVTVASTVIICGAQAIFCPDLAHAAELIWTGDFETGDFSQYKAKLYGGGTLSAKKIVTSPVRAGKYATALTILGVESDRTSERAELVSQLENKGGAIKFEWDGPEYWVGFSFMFDDWVPISYTFFQLHAPNEPKGDSCDFAGNTFSIWGDGANSNNGLSEDIVIRVIEDGGVSRGKGAASNNAVVYRYPFPIDEWQDYVVNFKLSTRGDGFYKVWKNGELIYSKSGLTNVNYRDSCGNLIPEKKRSHNGVHIGIYAPGVTGFRRIYYDAVRVAKGSDAYSLVAPDQSDAPIVVDEPDKSMPQPPVIVENPVTAEN